MVAALRGNVPHDRLAGGSLVMSIHPTYQRALLEGPVERALRVDEPVPAAVLEEAGAGAGVREGVQAGGALAKADGGLRRDAADRVAVHREGLEAARAVPALKAGVTSSCLQR